jgi:hypothetical protein
VVVVVQVVAVVVACANIKLSASCISWRNTLDKINSVSYTTNPWLACVRYAASSSLHEMMVVVAVAPAFLGAVLSHCAIHTTDAISNARSQAGCPTNQSINSLAYRATIGRDDLTQIGRLRDGFGSDKDAASFKQPCLARSCQRITHREAKLHGRCGIGALLLLGTHGNCIQHTLASASASTST